MYTYIYIHIYVYIHVFKVNMHQYIFIYIYTNVGVVLRGNTPRPRAVWSCARRRQEEIQNAFWRGHEVG